jgi:hypothetical protein
MMIVNNNNDDDDDDDIDMNLFICYQHHHDHHYHHRHYYHHHHYIIISGEMFRVTTFPLENIKKIPVTDKGDTDFTKDFFGKPTYLTVSGQLSGMAYNVNVNVNVLLLIDNNNDAVVVYTQSLLTKYFFDAIDIIIFSLDCVCMLG